MKRTVSVMLILAVWSAILLPAAAREEAATVMTGEDIQHMNAGSIQDLLNQLPGIAAGDSSISIRGSYKVRVFLDGTCINDPTSTIGAVKWGSVSLNQIERIEILKSGGASSYGANASGGVILIQTRPPEQGKATTRTMVEGWAGNFNIRHGYASIDQHLGKFSFRGAAGFDFTDGYWENSDRDKHQAEVKLAYHPRSASGLQNADVTFFRLEEEKGYAGIVAYPTPNARNWYDLTTVTSNAAFTAFKNRFYHRRADNENKDIDDNLAFFIQVTETGDELTIQPVVLGPGRLITGVGVQRDEAGSSSFSDRIEDKCWLFASYSGRIMDVTFTAGTRGSYHTQFGTSISPEVKITYSRGPWSWVSRLNLSHNTPSFYQRYNRSSSTIPNPDLDKEKARNLSTEFTYAFSPKLSATLSPYYNRIEDRITYIRDDTAQGQYRNLGEVTYTGVDISFNADLQEHLSLSGNWSYLVARNEETGNDLTSSPRHRLKSDLIYRPFPEMTLRLTGKYTGRAYSLSDNSESVGGYTLWNFRAEYRMKSMRLFLDIKNCFDTQYMYAEGYRGNPRTVYAGLRWQL